MHFFYNVSFLESNERILQAEFHLFKMRPKNAQPKKTNNPHLISVSRSKYFMLFNNKADIGSRVHIHIYTSY